MSAQPAIDWKAYIKSGNRLFIGSNAAVPNALIEDLIAHSQDLNDIEVVHILTLSDNVWAQAEYKNLFKINTLFIGGEAVRQAVAEGRADYTPCFLSEVPQLFEENQLPLDAALIMLSPPDKYGYCSMGVSVDVVSAAAQSARHIIAQINPRMPRTNGHSFIHMDQISAWMEAEQALPTLPPPSLDQVTERIGQYVSILVEDGATLQIGIGKIPQAVLSYLAHHKDLGVHSEMISDGILDLMEKGVINNRKKTFHNGKAVTTFCVGTQRLYDFVDGNPHIEFLPSEYVNSPVNISRNERMISINSAIEVDLTGQVVADSIGYKFYSGIGGQVDFVRGAALSKGGKPVIALPSTTRDGTVSRIVPYITEGAGVVTSRGHVHYIVTEFGIASLQGKSIRERALELIRVAHPDFREQLLTEVRKHFWVPGYQTGMPTSVKELGAIEIKKLDIDNKPFELRPLHPADERRLQEFFYSHTKETLLLRYNYHPKQMSREKSCNLVSVNQQKDLALCIVDNSNQTEVIHAVGRYYLIESSNSCEAAFVIRENHRGKGMAKILLSEMTRIARSRGISTMCAYVRKDNKPMLSIFKKGGFAKKPHDSVQEVYLELDLQTQ